MKAIDYPKSREIAEIIKAEPGNCATNVANAFLQARNESPDEWIYVEGVWDLDGQCGGHVWIEFDNTIIDPTLVSWPECFWQCAKVNYYGIEFIKIDDFLNRLRDEGFKLGSSRKMILHNDPRIELKRKEIDIL